MKKFKLIFISVVFGLFSMVGVNAAENNNVSASTVVVKSDKEAANDADFSSWTSEAELGFVKTTGNTETELLNFKTEVGFKKANWEHSLKLGTSRSADNSRTTAEKYYLFMKSLYTISERSYMFGRIQYEDDRFSGYNYQASEVIGYGRKIIKTETLKLNAEIGVGVRQNDFENGTKTSEGVIVFAGDADWKISEHANLTEELSVEVGEDNTISKSVTGLKTKINSSLSSKITYTVKHSSEVPVGTEKTDTELAVTLVYAFK